MENMTSFGKFPERTLKSLSQEAVQASLHPLGFHSIPIVNVESASACASARILELPRPTADLGNLIRNVFK